MSWNIKVILAFALFVFCCSLNAQETPEISEKSGETFQLEGQRICNSSWKTLLSQVYLGFLGAAHYQFGNYDAMYLRQLITFGAVTFGVRSFWSSSALEVGMLFGFTTVMSALYVYDLLDVIDRCGFS